MVVVDSNKSAISRAARDEPLRSHRLTAKFSRATNKRLDFPTRLPPSSFLFGSLPQSFYAKLTSAASRPASLAPPPPPLSLVKPAGLSVASGQSGRPIATAASLRRRRRRRQLIGFNSARLAAEYKDKSPLIIVSRLAGLAGESSGAGQLELGLGLPPRPAGSGLSLGRA